MPRKGLHYCTLQGQENIADTDSHESVLQALHLCSLERSLIINAPSAMRDGFAGEPLSGENRDAYCFSKSCQGTNLASFTQRYLLRVFFKG